MSSNNTENRVDEALKKANTFLTTGSGATIEEIKDSLLLQQAIGSSMSKFWKKRNSQEAFIRMFSKLPELISLRILKTTHEMFITTEIESLTEKDKRDWCNTVVNYIRRIDKNKTETDIQKLSNKIMEILNTKILYTDQDSFYDDEEDEDNYDVSFMSEDSSDVPTTSEILKPKAEIEKEKESKPIIDNNPNSIASTVLNGETLKKETIEKIKISKKFAIAYSNALSLQVVLGEAQEKKGIELNYLKGLDFLNEELFIYALEDFLMRRQEIITDWKIEAQKTWFKAVKESQLPERREEIFFRIVKWQTKKEASVKKVNNYEIKENLQKGNVISSTKQPTFYDDMLYFFESDGLFREGYFDKELTKNDYKLMGEALSKVFINFRDDDEKLELYSKGLSHLDIDSFTHAIQCLMNNYKAIKVELNRERKKQITLQILYQLKDFGTVNFEEYRKKLIHTISGYAQIENSFKDEDDS